MAVIAQGARAPSVPGVELATGPWALWFYKVTCPVCQMAAPVAERLSAALPGRVIGVGQDPPERLQSFANQFGASFETVSEQPPYPASQAYGIVSVPTLVLVEDGRVTDVVESWDRDGYNRIATRLFEAAGDSAPATVSHPGDGLPAFRPG